MTADLVRWLHAQLDTDERIAREAPSAIGSTGHSDGAWADPQARWVADHHLVMRRPLSADEEIRIVTDCAAFGGPPAAAHIAAHDPARVLREIEAKRSVVKLYVTAAGWVERADEIDAPNQNSKVAAVAYLDAVKAIAAVYADRPGYAEAIASVE